MTQLFNYQQPPSLDVQRQDRVEGVEGAVRSDGDGPGKDRHRSRSATRKQGTERSTRTGSLLFRSSYPGTNTFIDREREDTKYPVEEPLPCYLLREYPTAKARNPGQGMVQLGLDYVEKLSHR